MTTGTGTGPAAPFLDIFDPRLSFDGPEVAAAQEQSWYATVPGGILVLRHREVSELLRDRRLVKGPERYLQLHQVTSGPLYDWWMNMLSSQPAADHTRIRGLVNKAFSPRLVDRLRPFARTTADRLAGQVVADAECEFVAAFADPFPAYVICALLGVPPEDYDTFHRHSLGIGLAYSRNLSEELPRIEAALLGLSGYISTLIARRRRDLGEDLLSTLIRTEQDGVRLSPEELHNLVLLLVWAGQDTTARQLGRALLAFAERPEQWRLLAEQPELAGAAVDEICRWSPQGRTTVRFAAEEFEYRGVTIPKGGMVSLCIAAANRDPRVFPDPHRFDITRQGPVRSLTFSAGPHYCLGTNVARMEMAEGLLALTRRFGPPTVTGPVAWRPPQALIQGPDALPLRFPERQPVPG